MRQGNILVQIRLATSKVGIDFWYRTFCIQSPSPVAKQLKT